MTHWTVVAVVIVVSCASARAQGIQEELRGLLESHPQIQAKTKSMAAAEEGIDVAYAGYLPTVRLVGDSGPEHVDSVSRSNTQGKKWERSRESSSITLTQHLFDGFATDATVDTAKAFQSLSESDLRNVRQSIFLEGVTNYIMTLRASRLIKLAHKSEQNIENQLKLENERVEKGGGSNSDILAVKQRLQVAREARVRFEGELEVAMSKYIQTFNHPPDLVMLKDPPLLDVLLPPSLDKGLAAVEKNNPQVISANIATKVAGEKRNVAESGYYPVIDLVGRGGYSDGMSAEAGLRREWSVLVSASWELFSGLKTNAAVAQAAHEHAASQNSYLYAIRKGQELVRTTWHKLATARKRLELLESAGNLAEEVWAGTRERHATGSAAIRDVLDDETKIYDSRISYAQAYYDMINATYELIAATGEMELDIFDKDSSQTSRFRPPKLDLAESRS